MGQGASLIIDRSETNTVMQQLLWVGLQLRSGVGRLQEWSADKLAGFWFGV